MSTQKNEHNPDWTPNQYGAPDWRLLSRDEDTQQDGDEWWDWEDGRWMLVEPHMFGKRPLVGLTYRRRITPPTDTTGSGREGETPETDAAKKYSVQLYPHQNGAIETVSADFARQLERQRDAALAQVEALRRDGERLQWLLDLIAEHGTDGLQSFPWSILDDPANDPDEDDPARLTPILDRAAIDSAQRQEGRK